MKRPFVSVIIPAAGSGKRMNSSTPKQFIELGGKPILFHTIKKFEQSPHVSEIIIVSPKTDIEFVETMINTHFKKVKCVIEGGKERQNSVQNGLNNVAINSDIIIVHDGVRPFINQIEIEKICSVLQTENAAVIAVPVKNTIKTVERHYVKNTPDRSTLWAIQTPQGMKATVFKSCYEKLKQENILGTDESMIAEHYGYSVNVIEGNYKNIKITTPEDLEIGELFLAKEKNEN
jgi:2-C-methyl-D-erythritol 4-phosphate cytidylyltransferase